MNAPSKEHEQLALKALGLWTLYGENYRTYPEIYEQLLAEKTRLNIPGRRISNDMLRCYPEIPFLMIESREVAFAKLMEASDAELQQFFRDIEGLEINCAYRSYKSKITDFRYRISQHGKRKPQIGYNPDHVCPARNGGRKPARRSPGGSLD